MRGCFYIKPGGTAGVCISALVPAMFHLYGMRAFLFGQTGLNPGITKGEEK